MPASQRAEILSALTCVDYVIVFEEPTPEAALCRLRPDVHCKGLDYAPAGGKPMPEAAIVRACGGRIELVPLVASISTSHLIRRIQRIHD
jgi:bifunctional ADP-heptose synthase (sugar kinase/adenylyltransferase)